MALEQERERNHIIEAMKNFTGKIYQCYMGESRYDLSSEHKNYIEACKRGSKAAKKANKGKPRNEKRNITI